MRENATAALFLKNNLNLSTKLVAASTKKYFKKCKLPLNIPPSLKNRLLMLNEKPDHSHKNSSINSLMLIINLERGILITSSTRTIKYAPEWIFELDLIKLP